MSKERELLQAIILKVDGLEGFGIMNIIKESKELLAQPEQEPVELEDVIKQIHDKCYQTSFDSAPVIAVRDALTIFRNYLKSKRDISRNQYE